VAREISRSGDRSRVTAAMTMLQATIALVERAHFAHAVSSSAAAELVTSIVELPWTTEEVLAPSVARWMVSRFLPAAPTVPAEDEAADDEEAAVLRAMAGVGRAGGEARRQDNGGHIEWEGLEYRLDLGAAERRRLGLVRTRQGGHRLGHVLQFIADLGGLESTAERAGLLARLEAFGREAEPLALASDTQTVDVPALVAELVGELTRGRFVPAQLRLVKRSTDVLLADTLRSIVYATALGDPDGAPLMGSNVARRHRLGLESPAAEARVRGAWSVPAEQRDDATGWHVVGSLLVLDVGLARLSLRRVGLAQFTRPTLNEADRLGFAETVTLMDPRRLTDLDRDLLAAAIRRGRARLEALIAGGGGEREAAELARSAGLAGWRRRAFLWEVRREPNRAKDFLAFSELLRAGLAGDARLPDAWGASMVSVTGCPCLEFPSADSWEAFAGRRHTGLVASRFVDLNLKIAEILADQKLPAELARDLLRVATQDFIDEATPRDQDDWFALARYVASMPPERFDDYISALAAGGPLVPVTP
jgi:hypothetical protein